MKHPSTPAIVRSRTLAAALFAALLFGGLAASADDRDLLRKSSADPYVFIVLDTSGSMHWTPRCTAETAANDLDPNDAGCTSECLLSATACERICPQVGCVEEDSAGNCLRNGNQCVQPLCELGDCYTSLNGDDPSSKFYQAKESIYEVLRRVDNVYFGFATYNQDQLRMVGKHWLYRLKEGETGVTLDRGYIFPPAHSEQVFGRAFNCDSGGETTGHSPTNPARLTDAWALDRVRHCAQLGQTGTTTSASNRLIYLLDPGPLASTSDDLKYRIQFRPKSGEVPGDTELDTTLRLERCNNSDCSSRTFIRDRDVKYDLISDFNAWDNGANREARQYGYFSQGNASDGPADGNSTCNGWEPNTDTTTQDPFNSYSIKQPTTVNPTAALRPTLDLGDVIPLDWTNRNRDKILERLAPNRILGEASPDFRSARYFQDTLTSSILQLRNSNVRPLLATGSTPLGNTLRDFKSWFQGFKSLAGARDPDWACRKKYLLVLTDGDDTCNPTDPCVVAPQLKTQDSVETIVVGFGLADDIINGSNKLNCMATAVLDLNGDGVPEDPAPFYPQNKDELVGILTDIFDSLTERPSAFASAAVPSVQANVKDKIFLSSFVPLNEASIWSGHIDAFLKPLPIDSATNKPDESVPCTESRRFSCHLWDAAEEIVEQAPDASDVAAGNLGLGNAEDQRRVFYPQGKNLITAAVPNTSRMLEFPDNATERQDLWDGMGLNYSVGDLATAGTAVDLRAKDVLRQTFVLKSAEVDTGNGTENITYVLGDVFHSNPTVVDKPDDFELFARNEGGSPSADATCPSDDQGYRCFARKHATRRKMLAVGANDGMLHLFDAGKLTEDGRTFDDGSGKEVFAFAPRAVLPILKDLADSEKQIFSVDGSPRVANVFIDPAHTASEPPSAADREWRTVLVSGMREGGSRAGGSRVQLDNGKPFTSAYFALDITQPDRLDSDHKPVNRNVVPSCIAEYSESECGPIPFGSELWEFTDSIDGSPSEWGVPLDEDNNGYADLGESWSQPVLGKIRIDDGTALGATKYVAIFGGGLDSENRASPRRGTYLYMVDIETGETLYKRQLEGAVPATPAAIDISGDGAIDAIFIGTTAGYLYKVDTSVAQPLVSTSVRDLNDNMHTTQRITNVAWTPFKIFDTVTGGSRRAIFFQPTIVLVSEAGKYAILFGTGDREQLWNFDGVEGRIYAILDENFRRTDTGLPRTESKYQLIDAESAALTSDTNLLVHQTNTSLDRGFILTLDPDERVVAPPFSVSGITIFPTFKPQIVTDDDNVCARTGDSRIFVVLTTNANPLITQSDGTKKRYLTQGETLVTPPFVDQGATGNSPGDGGGTEPPPEDGPFREEMIKELKKLFPGNCRFAGYTLEVSFLRSDTQVATSIPIPICVIPKNFKSL